MVMGFSRLSSQVQSLQWESIWAVLNTSFNLVNPGKPASATNCSSFYSLDTSYHSILASLRPFHLLPNCTGYRAVISLRLAGAEQPQKSLLLQQIWSGLENSLRSCWHTNVHKANKMSFHRKPFQDLIIPQMLAVFFVTYISISAYFQSLSLISHGKFRFHYIFLYIRTLFTEQSPCQEKHNNICTHCP